MQKYHIPLRLVLGLVAAIHLSLGLLGVIPSTPLSIALALYGGALQFSPQISYLVQIFGAYMLTIGALCVYAVWDPVKNRSIVHALIFLLLFRGIQRVFTFDQLPIVFGVVPEYYWLQTVLFIAVGLALLWLRPKPGKAD